jgi:hypothetical protein
MLPLVTFHQQSQEFDCLHFIARRIFQRRQSEQRVRVRLKFRVVMYNARSALRDEKRRGETLVYGLGVASGSVCPPLDPLNNSGCK